MGGMINMCESCWEDIRIFGLYYGDKSKAFGGLLVYCKKEAYIAYFYPHSLISTYN